MKTHRSTASVRSHLLSSTGLVCSLGLLLPACVDAEPRDLGFTQASDELSVDTPLEPFLSPSSDFVGRWLGSALEPLVLSEDGVTQPYAFPSGSTRIELVLEMGEQGFPVGRIVFGAGEPPPPPVDAEAGYPVGVGYSTLLGYGSVPGQPDHLRDVGWSSLPPFEGFAYSIELGGSTGFDESGYLVPDGVAQLAFNTVEVLAPWCELQTPERSPSGEYSCAPDLGGQYQEFSDGTGATCEVESDPSVCSELMPDILTCGDDCDFSQYYACRETLQVAEVNCDKLFICRAPYCQCNAVSCGAFPYSGDALRVRRVGDELIGVFENTLFKNARGLNVPLGEVRLRLQP